MFDQSMNGKLFEREAFKDGPPSGIGEGSKDIIGSRLHSRMITRWLWIGQGLGSEIVGAAGQRDRR